MPSTPNETVLMVSAALRGARSRFGCLLGATRRDCTYHAEYSLFRYG